MQPTVMNFIIVHGPSNGKLQELVSSSQNKIGVVTEFSNLKVI